MARNLVVCCDGTSNEVAGDATNVLRLYRCLERSDRQLAFYDSGVGTVSHPDRLTERGRWFSRMFDQAFGISVRSYAIEAYLWLARHYQPGDQIYLFGFSRGAYTVRAVAGMIRFLGLVRPELNNLGRLAWALFSGENRDQSVGTRFEGGLRFRKSFAVESKIHFVGVWDTVSSYGWFGDLRSLPHTANNNAIDHVRHAQAIDERRAMFQPNHFRPKEGDHHTFKQVWFAGAHADVGGGYPETEGTLSKVSLGWMLREATQLGLLIDPQGEQHQLNDPPKHPPADAMGTVHESLTGGWNLLEIFPRRSYGGAGQGKVWKMPNFWKRRKIDALEKVVPTIHQSVLDRRNNTNLKPAYQPELPAHFQIEK